MKKAKRIFMATTVGLSILTAVAGLAACGGEETPDVENGTSTTLKTDKAPDELTPENAVYAFLQKQSELQSYVITAEGEAVADLAGYRQDIHNVTYKNGDDYLNQASSDSTLVKMKHQAFSKDGKVVYRDDFEGEMKVAEKEAYKKVYGFTADDVLLGGYIVNAKTIRYATLEKSENDLYTYYIRLAGDQSLANGTATESATVLLALQAKAYGSLDNLPAFSDVDLRLTVKKDWTPVSYSSECSYDCKKIFNMSVTQTISCTYSMVNEQVEIPDVAAFNEKLGSAPSEVKPSTEKTDPLMQLAGAFGNTLDGENALSLPVSAELKALAAPISLDGTLELRLRRDALERGSFSDALAARLDLSLAEVPLLSQVADTLTVRYPGDGLLLVMLNNRASGTDNVLYTYSVDLEGALSSGESSLEGLRAGLASLFTLSHSDSGYTLTVKDGLVQTLNAAYADLLADADAALGNAGLLTSLAGTTVTEAEFTVPTKTENGVEKLTGISFSLTGTPAENITKGRKIDVSLDLGILSGPGVLTGSFDGALQVRLNPAALLTGDYFGIAEALLHLDIKPVVGILGTVAAFAPAGSLPAFVGPAMNNLDLYYTGDGILTLAINNEENQPLFVTQVDLRTVELPAAGEPAPEETPAEPAATPLSLLSEFRIEKTADSILFALGAPAVQAIDAGYQELVNQLVAFITESAGDMGSMAGMLIQNMLGATITDVEFVLGRTEEEKLFFDFAIKGNPAFSLTPSETATRLYSLTVTDNAALTDEERTALSESKQTAEDLLAQFAEDTKTAEENRTEVQKLLDEMDLSASGREAYAARVNAYKEKFDKLPANVKTLMTNASYLADVEYESGVYLPLLRVMHTFYAERVDSFLEMLPANDNYDSFENWDALNAMYDKATAKYTADRTSVTIPAVKDNLPMQKAIGEDRINAYNEARDAHETELAEALKAKIAASRTKYENAEDRKNLTDALAELMTDFKPAYDKLPEDKKALVEGYDEYVKLIYMKNIDAVTAAYHAVETGLNEQEVTLENLLASVKAFSDAYTWGFGNDYWDSSTATKQPWGTWFSALKPSTLSEEEQDRVTALNVLNRSFVRGEIAKGILEKYGEVIKAAVSALKEEIGGCKVVADGTTTWNFESVGEKAATLEKIHGLRFLLACMLPIPDINTLWGDDADLKAFADGLKSYESELAKVVETVE